MDGAPRRVTKLCSKCGQVKDLAAYNTRVNRHGKTYPRPECRECEYARKRQYFREVWYPANRERLAEKRKPFS